MSTRWVPKGFHTITPNMVADDAEQAVAFFKKAFGATENLSFDNAEREDYAL
jgi:PhnB protein